MASSFSLQVPPTGGPSPLICGRAQRDMPVWFGPAPEDYASAVLVVAHVHTHGLGDQRTSLIMQRVGWWDGALTWSNEAPRR